jgi:NAD(P)-dependent dehydrogenase (short-subunit alcohol dehydrogenase family)
MAIAVRKGAIITDASGGLGSAVAKRLAEDGFAVVVHYAGKAAPAEAVCRIGSAPNFFVASGLPEVRNPRDLSAQSKSAA